MYKVLIVDDEPFILEGLRHVIDWEEHGLEIAGQASNGSEALELLSHGNFHILLTDIKMPRMNGLELIREVKEREMNVRAIILSGYDDFEYVKEAVRLGIENYLLKPVIRDELSSTLLTTVEKIESELYQRISLREGQNIFRENLLYRWVTNNISEKELLERAALLNLQLDGREYAAALIRILRNSSEDTGSVIDNRSLLSFAVHNICHESIQAGLPFVAFLNLDGDIVMLFSDTCLNRAAIKESLQGIIHNVNTYLKANVFITLGSQITGYLQVHRSYAGACDMQEYNLVLPNNSLLDEEDIAKAAENRQRDIAIDFERFCNLLTAKKQEECLEFIKTLFHELRSLEGATPALIQNIAVELLYCISNSLKRLKGEKDATSDVLRNRFSDVFKFKTLDELSSWFHMIVAGAVQCIQTGESDYNPVIKQVLNYIHANYRKDISIKQLSHTYNINAAYLGQLFKSETGDMLTNYLNRIRVEKAKEMLLTTNLKASEISDRVGYVNPNYFYRIFKKMTGVSPTEYKGE